MATFYGFSGVLVRRTTAQSIPTSAVTKLVYDFERYDTDNSHTSSTTLPDRRDRLIAPRPGFYVIESRVRFAPTTASGVWRLGYEINAEGEEWLAETWTTAGQSVQPTMMFAKTVLMDAKEYITIAVWQSTGVAVNTSTVSGIAGAETVFRAL